MKGKNICRYVSSNKHSAKEEGMQDMDGTCRHHEEDSRHQRSSYESHAERHSAGAIAHRQSGNPISPGLASPAALPSSFAASELNPRRNCNSLGAFSSPSYVALLPSACVEETEQNTKGCASDYSLWSVEPTGRGTLHSLSENRCETMTLADGMADVKTNTHAASVSDGWLAWARRRKHRPQLAAQATRKVDQQAQ